MQVREYIQQEIVSHHEEVARLSSLLNELPNEVGALESDSVQIWESWLILRDTSHKDLGARLATITGQTLDFKVCGTIRTAVFRDVGPFYKVDLDRPNPKCRKVRVLRPAKELEMEICGDLPEGYELLEELDGA